MAGFKNFIPKEALVLRDGAWGKKEAKYLVPGDIIKLNGGDNIPADCILITANEMKVNNASLTGESEDILREVDTKHSNIFESPNVGFFGTMCTGGTGTGMVFKTGDSTVIGRIAGLASSADTQQTTLAKDIEKFIQFIAVVAIFLGVLFFFIGIGIGYPIINNIIFAIGILVANVPEGLLATVTVSLALTAKRMANKFVLVKNMEAIETLGSSSCICSDKTGTLTQNRMSVSHMFFNGSIIDASTNYEIFKRLEEKAKTEQKSSNISQPSYDTQNEIFKTFIETIALATISFFEYQPSSDQIRAKVAKATGKNMKQLPSEVTAEMDTKLQNSYVEARQQLIDAEESKPYIKRNVEGDASETGLVKFIQPLLMDGPYGCYNVGGIDGIRNKYPIIKDKGGDPYLIPFSSDIKFNLIIRNMKTGDKAED